jgi:hypothetical protein
MVGADLLIFSIFDFFNPSLFAGLYGFLLIGAVSLSFELFEFDIYERCLAEISEVFTTV